MHFKTFYLGEYTFGKNSRIFISWNYERLYKEPHNENCVVCTVVVQFSLAEIVTFRALLNDSPRV